MISINLAINTAVVLFYLSKDKDKIWFEGILAYFYFVLASTKFFGPIANYSHFVANLTDAHAVRFWLGCYLRAYLP